MASPSPTAVSFHVVQIVYLGKDVLDACSVRPARTAALDGDPAWKDFPEWLRRYNDLSSTYAPSYCHGLAVDATAVEGELRAAVPWVANHCAEGPLSVTGHLFYEPHLLQWLMLYQLDFETDLMEGAEGLPAILPSQNRTEADFYNQLRDFFVVSDGIDRKSPLVTSLEDQGRKLIGDALGRLYGLSLDVARDVSFPDSAGNITLFALNPSFAGANPRAEAVRDYLTAAHECAERIGSSAVPQDVPDLFQYVFWGRFHTVMAEGRDAVERIMPIHFQAQLLWAYLSATEGRIQEVEGLILSHGAFQDGDDLPTDALINGIQYAHFMNERFRRSIEGDAKLIYRNIENRWHIDASLRQNKEFAVFLSSYIEHNLQKQSLKSESRQNKVLSVIAVLGFLALIDTWASFLDMANESYDAALGGSALALLFDSAGLATFNFAFSLVVTVICVAAIVYFLTRK